MPQIYHCKQLRVMLPHMSDPLVHNSKAGIQHASCKQVIPQTLGHRLCSRNASTGSVSGLITKVYMGVQIQAALSRSETETYATAYRAMISTLTTPPKVYTASTISWLTHRPCIRGKKPGFELPTGQRRYGHASKRQAISTAQEEGVSQLQVQF